MKRKALKAAFPQTIPIMTGFLFLGFAYGIYMNTSGFSFIYPLFMSMLIYGGSLEFVAVEMLLSPFAPTQVFIMALLIQARHLFYGLSMLDKFKGLGWKKCFVMTAMFVVIFLDQWLKEKNHTSSILGLGVALCCLVIFGPDSFMIPTMFAIILSLTILKNRLEKLED